MGRGSMIWIIIFLKVLAANNDGIYSRIKEMQCDTQLAQHFEILSKPMLKNIAIDYNEAVRVTNTGFNALYAGNDIIICGQLKNKNCKTMKVSINASCGKDNFEKEICVDIDCQTFNCNIERIWAYLTLKQCATKQLMIEGIDDIKNEQMAMAIAMKYKFVTPWTSMIVVQSKEQQSNKSSKKKKMPKSIPIKPKYTAKPNNSNYYAKPDVNDSIYKMNEKIGQLRKRQLHLEKQINETTKRAKAKMKSKDKKKKRALPKKKKKKKKKKK